MEKLLSRLQELKIEYQNYEHPAVMTVEQQVCAARPAGRTASNL